MQWKLIKNQLYSRGNIRKGPGLWRLRTYDEERTRIPLASANTRKVNLGNL